MRRRDLRRRLKEKTSSQISRLTKRLRLHGLIKKVGRTYKYYVTALGKQILALGLNNNLGLDRFVLDALSYL
jgi:hypothetical protein